MIIETYLRGELEYVHSFIEQGSALSSYVFNVLNGAVMNVDTILDSPPQPHLCNYPRSNFCSFRSATCKCQAEFERKKLCTILLSKGFKYFFAMDHPPFGEVYNTSLSTNVKIEYRSNKNFTLYGGFSSCCHACPMYLQYEALYNRHPQGTIAAGDCVNLTSNTLHEPCLNYCYQLDYCNEVWAYSTGRCCPMISHASPPSGSESPYVGVYYKKRITALGCTYISLHEPSL